MDGMIGEATMEQEPYGISRIIKKICENYNLYERNNNNVYRNLVDKYDNKSSTNKLISIGRFFYEKKYSINFFILYRTLFSIRVRLLVKKNF